VLKGSDVLQLGR